MVTYLKSNNSGNASGWRIGLVSGLAIAVSLGGCATNQVKQADDLAKKNEWVKAVFDYRKIAADRPNDIELMEKLKEKELQGAEYYYGVGHAAEEAGALDKAAASYQDGLTVYPGYDKLLAALQRVASKKDAGLLQQEGERLQSEGKSAEALAIFRRALQEDPGNATLKASVDALQKARSVTDPGIEIDSDKSIDVNFKQADLRSAFEFIAKSYGINVLFDDEIKSTSVTLYAHNVTFSQALDILLSRSKTFYKRVGPNTILVIPDTKDKRSQYEDLIIKTFVLNNIKAKDARDIIKGIIDVKKITIDEDTNSVIVRDTQDVLDVVQKIVDACDRRPAEVLIDVDIIEVNKTRAKQLGLDLGSQVGVTYSSLSSGNAYWSHMRSSGSLVLPTTSLRYLEQEINAKSLANPKIRVINGKAAKILIGDRVPLQSATIVDATGQTRTTYDYKDVGIKLNVEPQVQEDYSTVIKVSLEVSALGANVGTTANPAYKIGTRSAESYMMLRDGETAIIGGLIQDNDSVTKGWLPLLGDIPVLGLLFHNIDSKKDTTDVLLTLTPHVIRGLDVPSSSENMIYSGTDKVILDHPMFQASDAYAVDPAGQKQAAVISAPSGDDAAGGTASAKAAGDSAPAADAVSVGDGVVKASVGKEFDLDVDLRSADARKEGYFELLYNQNAVKFVSGSGVGGLQANVSSDTPGVIVLKTGALAKGDAGHVALKFEGQKSGLSFMVFKVAKYTSQDNSVVTPVVQSVQVTLDEGTPDGTRTDAH